MDECKGINGEECGRPLEAGQGPLCPHCEDNRRKKVGVKTVIGGGIVFLGLGIAWVISKILGARDKQST